MVSARFVPGTDVKLTVRNGAPGDLLLEAAAMVDRTVMDIDNGRGHLNDWGYAERRIRGGTQLSNHASGTAIDLEADELPLGKTKTALLTAARIKASERISDLTVLPGGKRVVRWGGDYDDPNRGGRRGGRPDVMHWELNDGTTEADCVAALAQLRRGAGGSVPAPATSGGDPLVRAAQAKLKANYKGYAGHLVVDGIAGPQTVAVIKDFQARSKLPTTGVLDAATRRALGV